MMNFQVWATYLTKKSESKTRLSSSETQTSLLHLQYDCDGPFGLADNVNELYQRIEMGQNSVKIKNDISSGSNKFDIRHNWSECTGKSYI